MENDATEAAAPLQQLKLLAKRPPVGLRTLAVAADIIANTTPLSSAAAPLPLTDWIAREYID